MKFVIYREATNSDQKFHVPAEENSGDWRWRLLAGNNRIVAEGGEGYEHASDLVKTVARYVAITIHARAALATACFKAGLTRTGRIPKTKNRSTP